MEGDVDLSCHPPSFKLFQSTPSAWRETVDFLELDVTLFISIHSLRMEGDSLFSKHFTNVHISIHSLRMEGDRGHSTAATTGGYFNPLPPHGGRHIVSNLYILRLSFQSTPSAWRETLYILYHTCNARYFNPLPPHGGRLFHAAAVVGTLYFNPLPPHGGRPVTPQWEII